MFPLILLPVLCLFLPVLYFLSHYYHLKAHPWNARDSWRGLILGHRGCRMETLKQLQQQKLSNPSAVRQTLPDITAYDIPENSMSSFRYAAINGSDGVECDVMLTRDNVIVVMHDDLLSRVMHSNACISQLTYAQLCTIQYKPIPQTKSYPYADADYDGQPEPLQTGVPTLEHLVRFCIAHNLKLMIEFKEVARPSLLRSMVASLFDQYNIFDTAFVASFHPVHIYEMRKLRPDIPTCLLYCRNCIQWYAEEGSHEMELPRIINFRWVRWVCDQLLEYGAPYIGTMIGVTMLGPDRALVSPQLIHDLAARNIHVYTWVVNDVHDVQALTSLGVIVGTDFCFQPKSILDKPIMDVSRTNSKITKTTSIIASPTSSPSTSLSPSKLF